MWENTTADYSVISYIFYIANCLVICNRRKFINANCTSLFHFCNYFILLLDQFSLYVHKGGLMPFIHSFIQASISCILAILQPWFNKFYEMLPQINQTRLTKCKFSTHTEKQLCLCDALICPVFLKGQEIKIHICLKGGDPSIKSASYLVCWACIWYANITDWTPRQVMTGFKCQGRPPGFKLVVRCRAALFENVPSKH